MILEDNFQSVFDIGVLRKNKEELQLLQLGEEAETLFLVRMIMCSEDSLKTLDLEPALIMRASYTIVT